MSERELEQILLRDGRGSSRSVLADEEPPGTEAPLRKGGMLLLALAGYTFGPLLVLRVFFFRNFPKNHWFLHCNSFCC